MACGVWRAACGILLVPFITSTTGGHHVTAAGNPLTEIIQTWLFWADIADLLVDKCTALYMTTGISSPDGSYINLPSSLQLNGRKV